MLASIHVASASLVRCRFGYHDPVQGVIFTDAQGLVKIRCASSSSEAFGRSATGYEFVSVSINQQNFLPSLDGDTGCILNPDSCAQFKYYTQNVFSVWPSAGPAAGGSQVTIVGEFSPGYDGVRTSANCLFRSGMATYGYATRRTSTVQRLEAVSVSCPSTATGGLVDTSGGRLLESQIGVALNGAYVQDDSSDYVGVRNVCPAASFGSYQGFLQYEQSVHRIAPTGVCPPCWSPWNLHARHLWLALPRCEWSWCFQASPLGGSHGAPPSPMAVESWPPNVADAGGPISGGSVVTVIGEGFEPTETPTLTPALLQPSVRCLWSCTPQPGNAERCIEGGLGSEALLTRPTSVTETEIICATPPRAGPADVMLGVALNVYDVVPATCSDLLHNGDESGVDCGGTDCAPCEPTCDDGFQNGDETGIDCGGVCAFCLPTCSAPNAAEQDCQLPSLSDVQPDAGPTDHATLLTVRGSGFFLAGETISYEKVIVGQSVSFSHTSMPRCSFGHKEGELYETMATVLSSTRLLCRTPRVPLVGCYTLQVSLDMCDYHGTVQANCPTAKVGSGLAYAFVPKSQYPGYAAAGAVYSYPGDFVLSGQVFKFFQHAPPTFSVRASEFDQEAIDGNGMSVAAGGPLQGGTELTITYEGTRSLAELPPFLRLDGRIDAVLNQSLCAFGVADGVSPPPYTQPVNVSAYKFVCIAPPREDAGTVRLRISLNGQQYFETGLHFQYFEHPNMSAIFPHGGLVTGATPVTVYGSGFRNLVPQNSVQRCSWGFSAGGERYTTLAKYDAKLEAMTCLSYLRGTTGLGAGEVPCKPPWGLNSRASVASLPWSSPH